MKRFSILELVWVVLCSSVFLLLNSVANEAFPESRFRLFKYRFGFPFTFTLGNSKDLLSVQGYYLIPLLINISALIFVIVLGVLLLRAKPWSQSSK